MFHPNGVTFPFPASASGPTGILTYAPQMNMEDKHVHLLPPTFCGVFGTGPCANLSSFPFSFALHALHVWQSPNLPLDPCEFHLFTDYHTHYPNPSHERRPQWSWPLPPQAETPYAYQYQTRFTPVPFLRARSVRELEWVAHPFPVPERSMSLNASAGGAFPIRTQPAAPRNDRSLSMGDISLPSPSGSDASWHFNTPADVLMSRLSPSKESTKERYFPTQIMPGAFDPNAVDEALESMRQPQWRSQSDERTARRGDAEGRFDSE